MVGTSPVVSRVYFQNSLASHFRFLFWTGVEHSPDRRRARL
ncbi:hypothetical protein A2U01_0049799, partial [Trifolium medium]|nr:hypothetical protein [Trifolium medium]